MNVHQQLGKCSKCDRKRVSQRLNKSFFLADALILSISRQTLGHVVTKKTNTPFLRQLLQFFSLMQLHFCTAASQQRNKQVNKASGNSVASTTRVFFLLDIVKPSFFPFQTPLNRLTSSQASE